MIREIFSMNNDIRTKQWLYLNLAGITLPQNNQLIIVYRFGMSKTIGPSSF